MGVDDVSKRARDNHKTPYTDSFDFDEIKEFIKRSR